MSLRSKYAYFESIVCSNVIIIILKPLLSTENNSLLVIQQC